MGPAQRKFHRAIAPWLVLPLVLALLTGICYRVGKAWFHLDIDLGDRILEIHSGSWMGAWASLAYVLVVGISLLALVATGSVLLFNTGAGRGGRFVHRIFGFALFLPLTATALTGMAYKIGEEWIGLPDDTLKFLLVIHEGAWLGRAARPWYVLFVGLNLLALIISGLLLTKRSRRIRWN
jgi:hypothetical protein